jgi:RNA polymerase sporulation-specific sigma factor
MAPRTASSALQDLTDEELAARFQNGCPVALDVLLARYRRFARSKARAYFLVGGDAEDVEQEGLIGLFKAARDFRDDREASFRAFAELCVTRQVITAIKTATRQKHQPLNQYLSISSSRPGEDGQERSGDDVLEGHFSPDPAEEVVASERMNRLRNSMAEMLSGLEVEVLSLYVEGRSYQEIGDHLDRHTKSIDNALQRIKRKLDQHLETESVLDQQADLALVG